MVIEDLFDRDLLVRMETEGYIRRAHHPRLPLSILNYTAAAQYGRMWNDVTMNCRGLIIDHTGVVVARGFPKFFNLSEHGMDDERLTWPFTISEKVDGSLAILWRYGDETGVATRGSFTSDQAIWATNWLHRHHPRFAWPQPDTTPLFEVVYPAYRIVVDYQGLEGLVFLGLLDNATGHTITLDRAGRWHVSFSAPQPAVDREPTGAMVGLDRGITVTVATSDGRMLSCPTPGKADRDRRARLQRWHARRVKGSVRRERTRSAIAKLNAGHVDRRKGWVEKTSTDLVRGFDLIVFEDLKVRNMMRSASGTVDKPGTNVAQKRGLNRRLARPSRGAIRGAAHAPRG